MRHLHRSLGVLALVLLAGSAASAQTHASRCADCHIANQQATGPNWSGFALRHLQDWDFSPHSRTNVGCEKCHGGNASTFEKFQAHQDMLPATSPASPVNRVNLPKTCGSCHTGRSCRSRRASTTNCSPPATIAGRPARHATAKWVPICSRRRRSRISARSATDRASLRKRTGRAAEAQMLMKDVRAVRAQLNEAQSIIRRVKDKTVRARFEEMYRQAEVPVIEARNAGHEFVFDNLKERLDRATQRAGALMDALANRQ